MTKNKIAIIGAGPAGISCAVQLKRCGMDILLLEKKQIGGLLRSANLVENYLGFESGISGHDLVEKFKKSLKNLDINPVFKEVKNVVYEDKHFHIQTDSGLFLSEILVVGSGTKPKMIESPINGEGNRNLGGQLFYETADLDKKEYTGKKFVIIGAGDSAFDYALNLAENFQVSEIIILNRGNKAKCFPLLEERCLKVGKIKHLKNVQVENIEERKGKVVLYCENTNDFTDKFIINTDYIMAATGREPCMNFLCEDLASSDASSLSSTLQQEGLLHFIGDVANASFRQVSISTGEGLKAAMKIMKIYT